MRPAWVVPILVAGCERPAASTDLAAASAATASPVPLLGGEARAHAAGELAEARDYSMRVESVRDCPLEPPFSARKGFVKLGIEVTIVGRTATDVPANPFYASARDPAGEAYAPTLAGCEPALPAAIVTAGKEARGFVTFEVPKAAERLELRYAPAIIGGSGEELRFTVAR